MTYEYVCKIALGITRMALLGVLCYVSFSTLGIWIIFIAFAILLLACFIYFLALCIVAGIENKYGEFDRYMWRKPKQLPPSQNILP